MNTNEIPESFREKEIPKMVDPNNGSEMYCLGYNNCLKATNAEGLRLALLKMVNYFERNYSVPENYHCYSNALEQLKKSENGGNNG